MMHRDGECKIAKELDELKKPEGFTAHDMANASADGYRSHKEHAAPLIKVVEELIKYDAIEHGGLADELKAALEQYKEPK